MMLNKRSEKRISRIESINELERRKLEEREEVRK